MERDDAIDRLLRQADNAAGRPRSATNLAANVRRRRVQRTRRRVTVVSMAACTMVGLAFWQSGASQPKRAPVAVHVAPSAPIDATSIRRELDQIERSVDARLAALDQFMLRKTERELAAQVESPDPVMELQWQREQAALILVRQGDRLANELNLPAPAALAYRQASETFPDTHWATVAQARLAITPTGMN